METNFTGIVCNGLQEDGKREWRRMKSGARNSFREFIQHARNNFWNNSAFPDA
jgi:hypothetical protein